MKKLTILFFISITSFICTGQNTIINLNPENDTITTSGLYNCIIDISKKYVLEDQYNQLADSLFARMDVEPSDSLKFTISRLYDTLEYYGAMDSLDRFGCFAVHTEQAALLDWIQDTFCTAVNSPLFTEYEGFTGDGLSAYLNTNYNPGLDTINFRIDSMSAGLFVRSNILRNDFDFGSTNSAYTERIQLNINYGGNTYAALNSGSSILSGINPLDSGLYSIDRKNINDCYIYINGEIFKQGTLVITKKPIYPIYIIATNKANTPFGFSTRQYSFWFVGRSISQFLHQKIAEACEDFLDYFNKGVIP